MKKLKFKWFYINSFIVYIVLILFFSLVTIMFLEQFAYNFLVSHFVPVNHGSNDIIEVVVDDRSVEEKGRSWNRSDYADILAYFHKYTNANVIGLDVLMSTYDDSNSTDKKLLNQISKMDNLVVAFLPESTSDFSDEELLVDFSKKFAVKTTASTNFGTLFNGLKNSSKELLTNTKYFGSVLVEKSQGGDNVISSSNLVKIDDNYYPSLALKMYLVENNVNDLELDYFSLTVPKTGLKIPVLYKSNGLFKTNLRFYKNYSNEYSHITVPAYVVTDTYYALEKGITPENSPELFQSKYLDPIHFEGKAIFIGSNISGPAADVLTTPLSKRHPGVDIQATAYDNIKNAYFLTQSDWVSVFTFFLLSILSFLIIMRSRFLKGLLLISALDIAFLLVVFFCATKGHIVGYAVPLVCQFVTSVFAYSFKFITENRNKEKIKQAMGKYLSQDVMRSVVNNIDDLKLGGKRAVVTVLFSDIRGFTSMSEKMSAEDVSMILNEYFTEMEPIITKYNGVINKFIGDAVMAIFGEPIQDINHPQNAVKCAYEMLKKVEYLREKWLYEGKPKIEIGVGINTGEVFIGNIGSESRMEYTVIGDTVNLASRIESYNKVYRTNLLVSSSTYEYISDIADVIKISEVQIRGKAKKMNIYEVLRIDRNS